MKTIPMKIYNLVQEEWIYQAEIIHHHAKRCYQYLIQREEDECLVRDIALLFS